MTIKNRLQKLEKTRRERPAAGDTWKIRAVDYRAGIVTGIDADADAIPVKFVDYMQRNDDHKNPTNET